MPTDDERREVARRMRGARYGWRSWERALYDALGVDTETVGLDVLDRLAYLIEPTDGFDLDTVQRVCFERMEGCDEPEWTLYTTIHAAIARYKRGESGPTCDRDALLALADEMDERSRWVCVGDAVHAKACARRIREALGVPDKRTTDATAC